MAKAGRKAVKKFMPELKAEFQPDMVIINGENSAHGFGISPTTAEELFSYGADVITGGNHSWDRSEIVPYIQRQPNLLRPSNGNSLAGELPGQGSVVYSCANGQRVLVISILCRLFMDFADDPFRCLDGLLPPGAPGEYGLDAVVVDCHGEATSEKRAIGHFADGRATLVVGTHTHVPTADAHVQPGGTGYQTDSGMCGDYDSVIGFDKEISLKRFLGYLPKPRFAPAEGKPGVSGVMVETEPKTGLCQKIIPISRGCF